tara:strand:+ start:3419 stop:3826 length:408 start_codon:yes stop_codon:yes gene_type:complete
MIPDFKALIDRLKINEGFRSKVYKCTAGVDTFGHGLTWITEEESAQILANRVSKLHLDIGKKFDWYDDMPPEVKGVVIEMCYQLGKTGFSKFKRAIAHMKNKEFQLASSEMLDSLWAKQTPNRANQLAEIVAEHG